MRIKNLIIVGLIVALGCAGIAFAEPTGAEVTAGTPETWNGTAAGNVTAEGGNITPVNLSAEQQTDKWQGFYGEVTGALVLRDQSGDQMYNWSLLNLSGEVYATRSTSVDWTTVAGETDCTTDEAITKTNSDRVNLTFTNNATLSGWDVGGVAIGAACQIFTFINNASQTATFEEIILNATGVTSIYATKIDADTTGFDGATHDYQMIVPANSTTQVYYFYVELSA